MLRVALTGGLGAGKSTAARMFATLGARVLSSDEMGRTLMQPGQAVYAAIAAHFGPQVVLPDGGLDRTALARIAFAEGRVEELNAIVHPAVMARQAEQIAAIAAEDPAAVVIVESALIFETKHSEAKYGATKYGEAKSSATKSSGGAGWRSRFDKVVLVTAPEAVKVARFVARSAAGRNLSEAERFALEDEALRRLGQQMSDEAKASLSDYVLTNGGPETELEWQVDHLWEILRTAAAAV